MADIGELDAGHHGLGESSQNVRKNIALHLKPGSTKGRRGRKPGRPKKEERPAPQEGQDENEEKVQLPPMKGPPEPLHRNQALIWDHKVTLVGRRHMDPHIHCCEKCKVPILIYGRVIPCKHVFCLDCAKKADKTCMRCGDPVQRIEQAALATVFICTHDGSKHGVSGCRRTYLSQRDLQAHVQYRHAKELTGRGGGGEPATGGAARSAGGAAPQVRSAPRTADYAQGLQSVPLMSPEGVGVPQQQQQGLVVQPVLVQAYSNAVTGGALHLLGHPQGYNAAQMVVPGSQQSAGQIPYSQAPTAVSLESYHTAMSLVSQQAASHGHAANLIAVPLDQIAGYDTRVLPPQLTQPPPGVAYVQQVYPQAAVSFATSLPPPHHTTAHMTRPPTTAHANMAPGQRTGGPGPLPVSSHSAMPPRGGPWRPGGQPYTQQDSGHWQGQGQTPISHRPRNPNGPLPRF